MRNALLALGLASLVFAELSPFTAVTVDHPAIAYDGPAEDPVARLAKQIASGAVRLPYSERYGYLRGLLDQLKIPVESQVLVFSKTSLRSEIIGPGNPRAIYFNDTTAVAVVNGAGALELASQDPRQGTIFYTLFNAETQRPILTREDEACINCHVTHSTMGVPGMIVRSVVPSTTGRPIRGLDDFDVDHRTPLEQRWGGWYVTGSSASLRHMGNAMAADPDKSIVSSGPFSVPTLQGRFRTADHLLPSSDLAPLMVLDHQMHLLNLFTRAGWEYRAARFEKKTTASLIDEAAREIADYMLFVDEAPLPAPLESGGGYAEAFRKLGPSDAKGRSLRQLDLRTRLLEYPLSYLIYSEAFDGMSREVRDAVYARLWAILSGQERGKKYQRLAETQRRALIEIVRDTKPGLPAYWR